MSDSMANTGFYCVTMRYGKDYLIVVPDIAIELVENEMHQLWEYNPLKLKNLLAGLHKPKLDLQPLLDRKEEIMDFMFWLDGQNIAPEKLPDEASLRYVKEDSPLLILSFGPKHGRPNNDTENKIIAFLAASFLRPDKIDEPFFNLWRFRKGSTCLFRKDYEFTYPGINGITTATILDSYKPGYNSFAMYNIRINCRAGNPVWQINIDEPTLFGMHAAATKIILTS
jgi:hypothetical protein